MKTLFRSILSTFRFAGRAVSGLRRLTMNMIFIVILGLILVSVFSDKKLIIEPNSILKLSIEGDLVEERTTPSTLAKLFENPLEEATEPETVVQDVIKALRYAATDSNIQLLLLDTSKMGSAGLDALQTIGQEITHFKKSGKKVIAVQDNYLQMQYYLASYADTVVLNPMGAVIIQGLGLYRLYFKDLLDRLQVTYNIFKVGSHKSAIEPLTRSSMSEEDRQQSKDWLGALWNIYTTDVQRERKLPPRMLFEYTNNTAQLLGEADGNPAELALQTGLVDKLLQRHEIPDYLDSQIASLNGATSNTVGLYSYLATIVEHDDSTKPVIAVAIAQGNILPGKQPPGIIGSETLIEIIQQAENDSNVKALVLRINSGGGSAFASEIIRQQLLHFKKSGKPLLVSMGRLAASGGYWISADADEIWASPSTLTGSIGIFGAIPTFEKSLAHLGIYSDGTGTSPIASALDISRKLPQSVKDTVQLSVEHGYRQFLDVVSTGRHINMDKMESLAQGRVFAAERAQQLGLVDNIGGLEQALESAAQHAGIKEYSIRYLLKPLSYKERILEFISSDLHINLTQLILGRTEANMMNGFMKELSEFSRISDPQNLYIYAGTYPY